MFSYLVMIFIILGLFFLYIKITSNVFIEFFNINDYKKIMLNNDKKKLFNIMLKENVKLYEEDCKSKCNYIDCFRFERLQDSLKKCVKCNSQVGKCFNNSIIGGNCDDCAVDEEKMDCYNTNNFGCANPANLQSNTGITPYYIEVPDNNVNSPFNKKCVFCWNILDNI